MRCYNLTLLLKELDGQKSNREKGDRQRLRKVASGARHISCIWRLYMCISITTGIILFRFGFRFWQTIAIILPIAAVVLTLTMIAVAPGPRTKEVVERLKNPLR